jgi:hypothetical protein
MPETSAICTSSAAPPSAEEHHRDDVAGLVGPPDAVDDEVGLDLVDQAVHRHHVDAAVLAAAALRARSRRHDPSERADGSDGQQCDRDQPEPAG